MEKSMKIIEKPGKSLKALTIYEIHETNQ